MIRLTSLPAPYPLATPQDERASSAAPSPAKPAGTVMKGFITEKHLSEAELEFPGITRFFYQCAPKPLTFLALVQAFISQ